MKRYYPLVGHYWIKDQPNTFYVLDHMGSDPIECLSWKDAEKEAERLNEIDSEREKQWQQQ